MILVNVTYIFFISRTNADLAQSSETIFQVQSQYDLNLLFMNKIKNIDAYYELAFIVINIHQLFALQSYNEKVLRKKLAVQL